MKLYICSNVIDLSRGILNLTGILCLFMKAFILYEILAELQEPFGEPSHI